MNYAIILAGGTGQRMRQSGMPKQFLEVQGKPIIIYTLETFQKNSHIDAIVIPCNAMWLDYMRELVEKYYITKVKHIIAGGADRSSSVQRGLDQIEPLLNEDDVVVIHDGVRPLIKSETIDQNVEMAKAHGNAMTVRGNVETIVITDKDTAEWGDFKNRDNAYTLTSPQSFRAGELCEALKKADELQEDNGMPLRDTSLLFARLGKKIHLVVEQGNNLKITTPEDFYYLKAYLELQASKHILGV